MGAITLTREQLYERVWSTPVATLAQELGLADVGVTKDLPAPADPKAAARLLGETAGKSVSLGDMHDRMRPALLDRGALALGVAPRCASTRHHHGCPSMAMRCFSVRCPWKTKLQPNCSTSALHTVASTNALKTSFVTQVASM